MSAQSRRSLRAPVIFIVLLAAITFLSKTIYNSTLPKVEIERVRDGTLRLEITSSALALNSDQVNAMRIEQSLSSTPLQVEAVYLRQMESFEPGDALLAFDPAVGEYACLQAQNALQECQNALDAWDSQWLLAWNALQLERLTLASDAQQPEADAAVIAQRSENLDAELKLLEQDKVLEGVYRSTLEADCLEAAAIVDCLDELRGNGWKLLAPEEGIISEIMVAAGDRYEGIEPLVRWVSSADPSLKIGIACNRSFSAAMLEDVRVTSIDSSTKRTSGIAWDFAGCTVQNGEQMLWARAVEGFSTLSDIQSLCFEMRSEYQSLLVPNDAVIGGDTVYVLESRTGAWGSAENVIRAVRFSSAQSDDQYTALSGDISPSSLVVVRWDRPLSDGCAVLVQ